MPAILNKESISIDVNKFSKAKKSRNKEELEDNIKKLINLANTKYNEVLKDGRNTHEKNFPLCKENYIQIRAIIDTKQKISSNLIKIYHLEAELACIQSDLNTLNSNLTSEEELNLFEENIKKIGLTFEKLKKNFKNLDPKTNEEAYKNLLTYHNNFSNSWTENSNNLLGDSHYNLAYYLEKESLINVAIKHYKKSADFYNKANSSEYETQTRERIKKLEITDQPIPQFEPKKITESRKVQSNGNKRKSPDTFFSLAAKKICLKAECTELLNQFKQTGVSYENYYSHDINPSYQKSLSQYKAILAKNHALTKAEELMSRKNITDPERIKYLLEETKNGFSYSSNFYGQAGLLKEKGKIIGCIIGCGNLLSSVTEEKVNHLVAPLVAPLKTEKSIITPDEKYYEYQHTYPTRYAQGFFKVSSVKHEQNLNLKKHP